MALRLLILVGIVLLSMLVIYVMWKWIDRTELFEKFISRASGTKRDADDLIRADREGRILMAEEEKARLRQAAAFDEEAARLRTYREGRQAKNGRRQAGRD